MLKSRFQHTICTFFNTEGVCLVHCFPRANALHLSTFYFTLLIAFVGCCRSPPCAEDVMRYHLVHPLRFLYIILYRFWSEFRERQRTSEDALAPTRTNRFCCLFFLSCQVQPRLLFVMASDGLLPKVLSTTDEQGVLRNATIVSGVAMIIIAGMVPFDALDDFVSTGVLLSFAVTNSCAIVVRRWVSKRRRLEKLNHPKTFSPCVVEVVAGSLTEM